VNLGLGEILVILLIAFVVVGPKDLPKIARGLGKAVRQLKGMYGDLKKEMDLDTELNEIKKGVRPSGFSVADDLADIQKELNRIK